jgi:hypothetical protein
MKRYLLSLLFALLAGTAWAQNSLDVSVAPETNTVIPAGTTGAPAAMAGTTAQAVAAHADHCEGGKCSKRGTVCVPAPDTITKTKVLFSSDCETKCHKALFSFLKKGGDCSSCPDGKCGHAHVERYLYKRVQTETCDSFKCVPSQRPAACADGKCVGASAVASSQPAPARVPDQLPNTPARATDSAVGPTTIIHVSAVTPRP